MHRGIGAIGVLAAALLHGPAALATPAWSDSFAPDVLATYLESPDAAVLVAGAGDEDFQDAAKAFAVGLRATGKARLVIDAAALGNVAKESDADIVKKASAQPVTIVAVLRVFPDADGRPPIAVVTLYSKAGTVLSALTVSQGARLQPRRASAQAVPSAAMDSVSQVVQQSPRLTPDETIGQKGIWLEDGTLVGPDTEVSPSTTLMKGKKGVRIGGPELYAYLGNQKAAADMRTRLIVKGGLASGGLWWELLLGSSSFALLAIPGPCQRGDCSVREPNVPIIATIVGINLVGLGAFITGLALPADPLSTPERLKLIRDFNEKVQQDAHGSAAVEQQPGSTALSWHVTPELGPGYGGLSLHVGF